MFQLSHYRKFVDLPHAALEEFYEKALGFRVDVDHRAAVYEWTWASGIAVQRVIASCS